MMTDQMPESNHRPSRTLERALRPRSLAMIGATDRPGSVGAAVTTNLLEAGFHGPIYLINPARRTVFGRPALPDVSSCPEQVDLAVLCTPAPTIPGLIEACAESGVGGAAILSAGFREAGPEGALLESRVRRALSRRPDMRAIGPNCLGLIVPSIGLNASFARGGAPAGRIAVLSQSGALCSALLAWAGEQRIGFSHFVSVGNMADAGFADFVEYLAADEGTTSIVLYVESITEGRRFVEAARRCTARKPIIVLKAGRYAQSARAAHSHTGAMAGEDAVYDAAFRSAGVIRIDRLADMLSTAELLGQQRWPRGPRLGIVTNAGGPGVIATDALLAGGGTLARLSQRAMDSLNAVLPSSWSHGNPIDVLGDGGPDRIGSALRTALEEDGIDAVLIIIAPQAMTDLAAIARAITAAAGSSEKPVIASLMGSVPQREARELLRAAGISLHETPERAVDAFLHLAAHARRAESIRRSGESPQTTIAPESTAASALLPQGTAPAVLSELLSNEVLRRAGIRTTAIRLARTRDEALEVAQALGGAVAMKVQSPDVTHKSDAGGVRLRLIGDEQVGRAFDEIVRDVAKAVPTARIEGVTLAPMIDVEQGAEFIVGARRDPIFGPIVLVGAGGRNAEVLGDCAIGLAPLTSAEANALVYSLRTARLLALWRGRPALASDALIDVILRIGALIVADDRIEDVEANPVFVGPGGAVALDARIVTRCPAPVTP